MSGEWKAPATGRRLACTLRSASADSASWRRCGAREHQLVGRVVVGHGKSGGLGHLADRGAVPAGAHGDHSAVAGLFRGFLHEPPAGGHEAQAVVGRNGAGGHEGADLAERVSGHQIGLYAVAQLLPAGEGRTEDRGLRPAGAVRGALEYIRAGLVEHLLEQVGTVGATLSRMSSVWLPCPGKSSAVSEA